MRVDSVVAIAAGPTAAGPPELFLEDALRCLAVGLRAFFPKKRITEAELAAPASYARLCVLVDELVLEGHLDSTDPERMKKSAKMK